MKTKKYGLLVFLGVILILVTFLAWLIQANRNLENRTEEFSNKLLPILRNHLVQTGEYDPVRFTLRQVGSRFVSPQELDHPALEHNSSVIIIDGTDYYVIMSDEPTTTSAACVIYNKNNGRVLKLILSPWTEWN